MEFGSSIFGFEELRFFWKRKSFAVFGYLRTFLNKLNIVFQIRRDNKDNLGIIFLLFYS